MQEKKICGNFANLLILFGFAQMVHASVRVHAKVGLDQSVLKRWNLHAPKVGVGVVLFRGN